MKIEELRPGDVLLLAADPTSTLSRLIVLLSGAPVSHAAITYRRSTEMIGISTHGVEIDETMERRKSEESQEDRKITVRRLPGEHDMGPVLDAGQHYFDEKEPYALSNLYMIGLMLLFRKVTPSEPLQKAMIASFKYLAREVTEFMVKHRHAGKKPMICSQFVVQCFEDAGEAYRLKIKNPLLQAPPPGGGEPVGSLLEQVDQHIRRGEMREPVEQSPLLSATGTEANEDELLEQLLEALESEQEAGSGLLGSSDPEPLSADLVTVVHIFAESLYEAQTGGQVAPQALQSALGSGESPEVLAWLKAQESAFITPADLLNRCENLSSVGEIL